MKYPKMKSDKTKHSKGRTPITTNSMWIAYPSYFTSEQ